MLAGRPDLIIVNGDDVLIIDVKTDQERPSHAAQLMIYMYALPRALQQYRDARIRGEVFYPTRTHLVGRGSLDQGFIRRLSPNPPMDTDGRREDSGRRVRELQAR